jgi:hypothetical protein
MEAKTIEFRLHEYFGAGLYDAIGEGNLTTEEILETEKEGAEAILISKAVPVGKYSNKLEEVLHLKVPCKVDWCYTCNGSGTRSKWDVEGYDTHAMISEAREDGDYEFIEGYFRGDSDITCDSCHGTKIRNVVDLEACNPLQKKLIGINNDIYQWEAECEAEREAERRAGC